MRIGFIGAGRMGFTLGKHITVKKPEGIIVTGYYSRNVESAKEAAEFTDTLYYEALVDLVKESDTLFITVPDGQIAVMAEMLDGLGDVLDGKIICHTSGALSSQVFSGMKQPVYGYSIHPVYAVNSKTESYINFSDCFITIEGHERYLQSFVDLFASMDHEVKVIDASNKVKYHASAVFASNLVVGLYHMAVELLVECGFNKEDAERALKPLFENNASNIINYGCNNSLTGPVARCDIDTVSKHTKVLKGEHLKVYSLLSKELIGIARENAIKISDSGNNEEINESYDKLNELIGRHL